MPERGGAGEEELGFVVVGDRLGLCWRGSYSLPATAAAPGSGRGIGNRIGCCGGSLSPPGGGVRGGGSQV